MQNWLVRPWRQCLDFKGRATRREYFLFLVQLVLVAMLIFAAFGFVSAIDPTPIGGMILAGLLIVFYVFAFVATLSASVRRLHDHDKTGWLYLLAYVPLIGWIFYLFMMLTPGSPGENGYGFDPREGERLGSDGLADVFA